MNPTNVWRFVFSHFVTSPPRCPPLSTKMISYQKKLESMGGKEVTFHRSHPISKKKTVRLEMICPDIWALSSVVERCAPGIQGVSVQRFESCPAQCVYCHCYHQQRKAAVHLLLSSWEACDTRLNGFVVVVCPSTRLGAEAVMVKGTARYRLQCALHCSFLKLKMCPWMCSAFSGNAAENHPIRHNPSNRDQLLYFCDWFCFLYYFHRCFSCNCRT